ncbi:MAG TPA: potassium channel family protein [Pyrinomonadaceae bacterium]|nr:potassium channel family protein [Pyrinomonadaceae bacterium]
MKRRRNLKPLKSAARRLALLAAITATSLVVTISLPFLLNLRGFTTPTSTLKAVVLILLILIVVPLIVAASVLVSIALPFDEAVAWRKRVLLVVTCFIAVVLIYAGVYFALAGIGDYNQAIHTNLSFQYAHQEFREDKARRQDLIATVTDTRPFKGMGYSLFLSIDEDPDEYLGDRRYLTAQEIISMAQDEKERVPRLNSGAALGLFGDCFHFSVVTAATVGYGDITPSSSLSRLVADSQVIASVSILVFGLGFVMSARPPRESEK